MQGSENRKPRQHEIRISIHPSTNGKMEDWGNPSFVKFHLPSFGLTPNKRENTRSQKRYSQGFAFLWFRSLTKPFICEELNSLDGSHHAWSKINGSFCNKLKGFSSIAWVIDQWVGSCVMDGVICSWVILDGRQNRVTHVIMGVTHSGICRSPAAGLEQSNLNCYLLNNLVADFAVALR